MSEPCRMGLLALGDSITRGDGEPALGVGCRSWALWLAEALALPYTNLAVDGAVARDVVLDQLPRVRADYDLACVYIGVNDARGGAFCDAEFESDLARVLGHLSRHAGRVMTFTIPLDLGRPRAGDPVRRANAIIRRLAGAHAVLCTELADLRGWRLVLPDAVHLTALGSLELAERAARTLVAANMAPRRSPAALAERRAGVRPQLRFAARWSALLARDLLRRRLERAGARPLPATTGGARDG